MNNFNVLLATIRQHCLQANEPSSDCFEIVKSALDSAYHEHLDFYLSFLEDLGLIKYNNKEKTIAITDKGILTEKVFS
jgi:predicted transcriptional regulator